ncbi:MAG: ribose 5-phosphate isomerase A [Gammaproteobacteria bacterium RIFCSPHIGHO2_02_FULL_39_13]|nr:MAG: ribose 5-phosphate isomerase A [Gammaproteobacteria bacterium RIFCSPHIGHO2_02_FULL_39_13]OGT49965.1 MAG: ribose 5-phosphate isomerase A [Gammaproteobacteria bacterium RIFCSPHIGHO2_12_FULL_39_24]
MKQDELKKQVANAALKLIASDIIVGVGSGSTVHYFIDALASIKNKIKGTVASSIETENRLKAHGIPVYDLNAVDSVPIYVDGADEFNEFKYLIKGGGGALTREKIIATAAKQFICIVDQSKAVKVLGKFPVPVEVISMARGLVARTILKMGGLPEYRAGFITDNGNIILDVYNLNLEKPIQAEEMLNNITGVVCNGIFAKRPADKILVADHNGIREMS